MALVETLAVQHGLARVDAASIDAFLASGPEPVAVLFFPGDPARMQDWSVFIERIGMMLAQGDAA